MAFSADPRNPPTYTVIAGPNGAGKSTLVEKLQKNGAPIGPFINPDVIAKNLPSDVTRRDAVAGRRTLEQTKERIDNRESFSRESTLSSREIMRSMEKAKAAGFIVNVVYVAVDSVEESIERVKQRVRHGGHDVPEDVQRRRFDKSLKNAASAGRVADQMLVFHNVADLGHQLKAVVEQGRVTRLEADRPTWVDQTLRGIPREAERATPKPPPPARRGTRKEDDRGR